VSDTLLLLPVAAAIAELDLSHTQVDSTLYAFLGRLPNLTVLNLAHTAVNEVGVEQLGNLSNLKRLNLTFTQVGPGLIPKLEQLPKLNTVYLFGTNIISDSIPQPKRESLKLEFGGFTLPTLESDSKIY
jgi:Leucine-rich repeat (LRR) protein